MSRQTGTWTEIIFANTADHTAVASTASETSLTQGTNKQPILYASLFDPTYGTARVLRLYAAGVFSNTGTPTLTFNVKLSTTAGAGTTGTAFGNSAAITTASGVTNVHWELEMFFICRTPAIGSTNTTISANGFVRSPAGFASPFSYLLCPASGTPQTWTAAIDGSLTQYLNLTATWSASSASNTITCKTLILEGCN